MISSLKWRLSLAGAFFFLFAISSLAQAQGVPSGTGLEISLSSNNPAPGQEVTLTAKSYSMDINSANITWTVDGKVEKKGLGANIITLKAPAQGKKINVSVQAVAFDGTVFRGSASLSSGSVDIIIETNGNRHSFFKGKLPLVYQNSFRIIAMPHLSNSSGVEYDPRSLVYEWKRNNTVLQSQSGYGRQYINLEGDIVPRPFSITVSVSPRDNSAQTLGTLDIDFQSPFVLFYVDDPLYGIFFNKAVGNTLRIGKEREEGILALPYGFNKPKNGVGDLVMKWIINGSEHSDLYSNESVILRAPSDTAGSSDIAIDIRNNKDILQGAKAGFTALFSASNSNQAPSVTF